MKEANIVCPFLRLEMAILPFVPQVTGQQTLAGDLESTGRADLVVDQRAAAKGREVGSMILVVVVKNPTLLRH
jgi:hypothetical protein